MNEPNIQFEASFFEGEERSGFYVDSIMKRAWAAQMEVLYVFDGICKKYNLRYFANSGTLLGAVRHKGYIPWDDDIDIVMPRNDYEKFLVVAEKELTDGIIVQYREDINERREMFATLINSPKVSVNSEFLKRYHNCPYVSGIDLLPLDYLPRDKEEQHLVKSLLRVIYSIIVTDDEAVAQKHLTELEDFMNVSFVRDETLFKQLLDYYVRICTMYTEEECDEVVSYSFWIVDKAPALKKEWYDEVMYMPFENIEIPVPREYDKILRAIYGSYMIPVRGTTAHEYPYYKKQQITLEKDCKKYNIDLSPYEGLFYKLEEDEVQDNDDKYE